MNKYKAFANIFKLLLKNRKEFLKGVFRLTKDLSSKGEVVKKYNLAKGLPVVDLLDLFPNFEETISNYSYLDGTSKVIDIALIKSIIKSKKDVSYIEFGSWRGESLVNIHNDAKETFSMTLSKKQMKEFGFPDSAIKSSDFFTEKLTNITEIRENTQTYDYTELKGKFDVIFVDADHEYPGVKIDTANAYSLLRDDNSMIVWHDYGLSYENINWPVLHGILDGIPKADHKHLYRVSNTICAIYTKQEIKANYPEISLPNKVFTVSIKAEKI